MVQRSDCDFKSSFVGELRGSVYVSVCMWNDVLWEREFGFFLFVYNK